MARAWGPPRDKPTAWQHGLTYARRAAMEKRGNVGWEMFLFPVGRKLTLSSHFAHESALPSLLDFVWCDHDCERLETRAYLQGYRPIAFLCWTAARHSWFQGPGAPLDSTTQVTLNLLHRRPEKARPLRTRGVTRQSNEKSRDYWETGDCHCRGSARIRRVGNTYMYIIRQKKVKTQRPAIWLAAARLCNM